MFRNMQFQRQKVGQLFPGAEKKVEMKSDCIWGFFRDDGNILELVIMVAQLCQDIKTTELYTLKQ